MGKREQHDRAKKILYNREKRTLLLRSYGEKDPTLAVPGGNNFARIVTHYMDISGTREADEKNIRMIREAQSVEGRRRLFARYLKEMRAVDLSVYFSSDIEKVLDYEEKHPSIFYMGFDSTYMIGGMTGGLALNENGKKMIEAMKPFLQQGNLGESMIQLAAEDYYVDKLPDDLTIEQGFEFYNKNSKLLSMDAHSLGWLNVIGAFNESAHKYRKFFEKLSAQNIAATDLINYDFFDESGKQMTISEALDGIATDVEFTYSPKSPEELRADENTVRDPTVYASRTPETGRTPIAGIDGVKGIGVSSVSSRAIENGTAASFFGGLNVTEDVKNQLIRQPAERILYFTEQPDKTFNVSFNLPDEGANSANGSRFRIRSNVNMIAQSCANLLFDSHGNMNIGSSFLRLREAREKYAEKLEGLGGSEWEKCAQGAMSALKIPEGDKRDSLMSYLRADSKNVRIFTGIIRSIENEVTAMAGLQSMEKTKLNQTEQTLLRDSSGDFNRLMHRYRHMASMDAADRTLDFPIDSRLAADLLGTVIAQNNACFSNRPISFSVLTHTSKTPDAADSEIPVNASRTALAISDLTLNGKNMVMSVEAPAVSEDKILTNNGKGCAIGFCSSVDEVEKGIALEEKTFCGARKEMLERRNFDVAGYIRKNKGGIYLNDSSANSIQTELESRTKTLITAADLKKRAAKLTLSSSTPGRQELKELLDAIKPLTGNETGANRLSVMNNIKLRAKTYLDAADPKGDPEKIKGMGANEWNDIKFARGVLGYASANVNNIMELNPNGFDSPYEQLKNAERAADKFVSDLGNIDLKAFARNTLYKRIKDDMEKGCHKKISPEKLAKKTPGERCEYFDDVDVSLSLQTIACVSNHAETIVRDMQAMKFEGYSSRFADELRFTSEAYKTILNAAKIVVGPQEYLGEHREMNGEAVKALNVKMKRAMRGLDAFNTVKKTIGDKPLAFIDRRGEKLDAKEAALSMLSGESAMIRKPGSTLECFCINADGELDPEPFIDPMSKDITRVDYRKFCAEMHKAFKATDRSYVWSNSETFDRMRDLLEVMSSPDRQLSKGQQKTAYENLERLSTAYIVKKTLEKETKGALNERSRSRLAIAHRLHAYARVLKDPEAYAARAEQQRSEKAMRQNASRPDSGVSLA